MIVNLKVKKFNIKLSKILWIILFLFISCGGYEGNIVPYHDPNGSSSSNNNTPQYANIDFSHWKLTLPVDKDNNGSPDSYQPNQLINNGYRTLVAVQPFMYDDTIDGSIVFYTYPDVSTTNSSYSRTELRELINPSNSKENWTLKNGGSISGRLKMVEVSKNSNGSSYNHPKVILMQIHGIISQNDMDLHSFTSNNAPPLLKMTWIDGNLWAYKKSLINENTNGDNLLDVSSNTWSDIKHNMGYVGYEAFDLQIIASAGKLEVILNGNNSYTFEDGSLAKWPFENYFKAGNYLGSTDKEAFSKLKYYKLTVTH
ncbi:polysaccharide lyase family 7 protein [Lutibacter sp.]|uniref:polysaccharide lyase family 7 protein n=1 Tax=Lutibacter sp. TaxID=1925666 RepID=UPI0025B962A0|nr:polysaccharide lyase family 7 protein [Lutibacter sp.]MCF6181269.1 polysaccharide lyase family 7 protein [Lutibacter sp.]